MILLIVATALLAYHYSRPATTLDDGALGAAEVARAREEAKQAIAGRERSTALAVQLENQLQIDRATQQQVQAQLKALENENARLKEDLSFFESLLPTPANSKGVVIRSFRLQALNDGPETGREPVRTTSGGPNQEPQALRYRLLVQQSGRPERDFVGLVSLTVSLQQGGRPWILQLPDATIPDAGPAPLSFRHYQRVEGVFELPEGAVVRSVQVKIQANGEVRAQQTFTM
ncbi:MAG: hypothetical protein H7X75_06390 [Burkholderiaceae bacterium]|nr:hypothetical protein [Burkholderiaceae bacterium]